MVAAARTMICVVFAAVSVACGVVLPPAEGTEPTNHDRDIGGPDRYLELRRVVTCDVGTAARFSE